MKAKSRRRQGVAAVLLLAALLRSAPFAAAAGDESWHGRQREGWFWYRAAPAAENEALAVEPPGEGGAGIYPQLDAVIDPEAELERVRREVAETVTRAVLQPSEENLLAYLQTMEEVLGRARLAADHHKRVLWRHPRFDRAVKRPSTSPLGALAWKRGLGEDLKRSLGKLAESYGLYFFVSGSCPYCEVMAPAVLSFAKRHDFALVTVSLDGGAPAQFPDFEYAPELARELGVATVPAVFLVEGSTGAATPVLYGVASIEEIERRLYRLFVRVPGEPLFDLGGGRPPANPLFQEVGHGL